MMNKNKGQGLLEFALVLPFLMVVVFGVLDLGRVYFTSITLTSAAREGARYLTVYPDDVSGDYSGTKLVAYDEARNSGINLEMENIIPYCDNSDDSSVCDTGSPAQVSVTSHFELILGWMLSSPITITRSAQMVVP
jgi:Flp pilus assembly protein TadG